MFEYSHDQEYFSFQCLEKSTLFQDEKISFYRLKCLPDVFFFTLNMPTETSNNKHSFPTEIFHLICTKYTTAPLLSAFILAQSLNGTSNYIFNCLNRSLYQYITTLLIHLNASRYLRYPEHDHPYSPFIFFFPPEGSLGGVYFKINSSMRQDKCFLLYFKEIIRPVVHFVFLAMQGKIQPLFVNFVRTEYAHLVSEPVNSAFIVIKVFNMFNCTCFRCKKLQLVFKNKFIYLENK